MTMTPTLLRLGCRPAQTLHLCGYYYSSLTSTLSVSISGASKSSLRCAQIISRQCSSTSTTRILASLPSTTAAWQSDLTSKSSMTGHRWSSTSASSNNNNEPKVDYLSLPHSSPEVQHLIEHQARKPQTSASLQTLMKTGRGEFLHKLSKHNQGGGFASVTSRPEDESEATPLVLVQVASFLRRELPIRLAHRIHDLSRVAYLQDMKSVQQVKELYTTSFLEILSVDKHPPTREGSEEWEEQFAKILENIYERHSSVLVQMARGAFELRAAIRKGALLGVDDDGCDEGQKTSNETELQVGRDAVEFELMESTHAFLDRFYISRIGIRVLIGQYLSLRQPPVEK